MNKTETITKLKEDVSLSTSEATKLTEERITMLTNEETRKTIEKKLNLINRILDGYTGENEK